MIGNAATKIGNTAKDNWKCSNKHRECNNQKIITNKATTNRRENSSKKSEKLQ